MTYAYRCAKCGAAFTVRATVAEKTRGLELRCPECGSTEAKQDFSSVGVLVGRGGRSERAPMPSCCSGGGRC